MPNDLHIAALPWQQTQREYLDSQRTGYISSDAYKNYSTSEGISQFTRVENYPEHLATMDIRGTPVEIRRTREPVHYVKTKDDDIVRDARGMAVYLTDEEARAEGLNTESADVGAFVAQSSPVAQNFSCSMEGFTHPPWQGDDGRLQGIQEFLGIGFSDVEYDQRSFPRPSSYRHPKIYDELAGPWPERKNFADKETYYQTLNEYQDRQKDLFQEWIKNKLREYGYEPEGDTYHLQIGKDQEGSGHCFPPRQRNRPAKKSTGGPWDSPPMSSGPQVSGW